jgi:transmembrane sensor
LIANQQATLSESTRFLKKSIVSDTQNTVAWQEGKLIFEDASLDEIATRLSVQYGIKTTLSNANLKNCRITAVFQNKSIKEILTVITKLTGSAYTLDGKEAVISGSGCNSSI